MNTACPTCGQPVADFDGLEIAEDALVVRRDGRYARLTRAQMDVFLMLYARRGRCVAREAFYQRLYAARPDCHQPDIHMIDSLICKIRAAVKPLGLSIVTRWSRGYELLRPKGQP